MALTYQCYHNPTPTHTHTQQVSLLTWLGKNLFTLGTYTHKHITAHNEWLAWMVGLDRFLNLQCYSFQHNIDRLMCALPTDIQRREINDPFSLCACVCVCVVPHLKWSFRCLHFQCSLSLIRMQFRYGGFFPSSLSSCFLPLSHSH